ncbi:MAG: phage tail tube protein [Christensenellales bacterium]
MGKKGRKNGCPVNIRNWVVLILDVATQQFVRIYGLTSLTRTIEGETEDGSADTDIWAEPYITKRSSSCDLEGDKKVVESTGEVDPGQEMLNEYAEMSGCDSDCTLKFVDPYGHGWIADYVVTSAEESSDDSDNSVTWSLEQVGEAEPIQYVQVKAIAAKSGGTAASTLAMKVGDSPKLIDVEFTPENASNQRFRVTNNRRSVVQVSDITESGFTLTAVGEGTANFVITSVNGAKTASSAVTVTAAS